MTLLNAYRVHWGRARDDVVCSSTGSEARLVTFFVFVRRSALQNALTQLIFSTSLGMGWKGTGTYILVFFYIDLGILASMYIYIYIV